MQMLEDGISFSHIHKNYGINEARLKVLWSRYQKEGISGLQKQLNINADYALKVSSINSIYPLVSDSRTL